LVKPLPPVPVQIRELYVAGKINVVEFADFQCPYCRRVHPILKGLVSAYGDQVAFTRLHKPIENHQYALGAAHAAICAEEQGQAEAMADMLFEGELGEDHYLAYAKRLGLDRGAFEACLTSPGTQARVEADVARFEAAGLRGLPTTFIGDQKVIGAKPMPVFRDALARAASPQKPFALSGPVYLLLSCAAVAALLWFGRWGKTEGSAATPT
jgi:protein-disulfide isomerase